MVLLIVRAMLRRPFSFWITYSHILFCAHIHNVVAKKRDASTELLQFVASSPKCWSTMLISSVEIST